MIHGESEKDVYLSKDPKSKSEWQHCSPVITTRERNESANFEAVEILTQMGIFLASPCIGQTTMTELTVLAKKIRL